MHISSNSIRIALIATAFCVAPIALSAQNTNPNEPGPPPFGPPSAPNTPSQMPANPGTQDSVGAPGMTGQMMRDKLFLRKAAEDGIAEIQFGQLAAQKSASPDIKAFGEKVVRRPHRDQSAAQSIADSMGVMLPKKMSKDDQAQYDKLKTLPPRRLRHPVHRPRHRKPPQGAPRLPRRDRRHP